ncbi:MAG: hypothetical protein ABSC50_02595 [Candidatus Bathyarchaeia archaeon]
MKEESLFLTVKLKDRLEAVDKFLDLLEGLRNVELHGDYTQVKCDDTHGLNYYTFVNVLIRDGRSPPSFDNNTRN